MMDRHHGWNKRFTPLFIGLALSFVLMVTAYQLATCKLFSQVSLMWVLTALACAQAICQFLFYFHLGFEGRPAWGSYSIYFMTAVVVIVIGGSIWIMSNLDYNTMGG